MTPFLLLAQLAQIAQPCTTTTTACERWMTYDAGPARTLVYASHHPERSEGAESNA